MSLGGMDRRRAAWGIVLSWLALCSALLSPASSLAQQMSEGRWSAICSVAGSSLAAPDGHANEDDNHCSLCLLPTLALPVGSGSLGARCVTALAPAHGSAGFEPAPQDRPPDIRGPPTSA
jgi:hypothetical protein